MRLAFLAFAVALVGACAPLQDRMHPGETALIEGNWLKSETTAKPPALYCYRTLGRQDCYRAPLQDGERRLVEHYGPPPAVLGGY